MIQLTPKDPIGNKPGLMGYPGMIIDVNFFLTMFIIS